MSLITDIFGGGEGPDLNMPEELAEQYTDVEDYWTSLAGSPPMGSMTAPEFNAFEGDLYKQLELGTINPTQALSLFDTAREVSNLGDYHHEDRSAIAGYKPPTEIYQNIINTAANTILNRGATADDVSYYEGAVGPKGLGLTDRNEILSTVAQMMTLTPEYELAGPFDEKVEEMAAYYGAPARDEEGRKTWTYHTSVPTLAELEAKTNTVV
jgi:hypothetical protein